MLALQATHGNQYVQRLLRSQSRIPVERKAARAPLQRFAGEEHRQIGEEGSAGKTLEIDIGGGKKLSYGDMVAIAGDYFGSLMDIRELVRTKAGQAQIRWARWHALGKASAVRGKEPPVGASVKKKVLDRYFKLASKNVSHFSAGGTAGSEYEGNHKKALARAFVAGTRNWSQWWGLAKATEAFGNHFLTDMFSAGHVRTPRSDIKRWYETKFPGSLDKIVDYIADFITKDLDARGDLKWYWPRAKVRKNIKAELEKLGGEALKAFSLGDIVSGAFHDQDNIGLGVVSDVDASGKKIAGGYRWKAVGDDKLDEKGGAPKLTRQMAVAAVKASVAELDTAFGKGAAFAKKRGRRVDWGVLMVETQRFVDNAEPFAAMGYVPREDQKAGNPQMDWKWGGMNKKMQDALDDYVKGQIASKARANAPKKRVIKGLHIGDAYDKFCKHLASDGRRVLEKAMK